MAVFYAKYTRSKAAARREIHYYVHRPERDGSRGNRDMFNADGSLTKEQAYQLVREAERGTKFFKIVISPDPNGEDEKRDLNLTNVTIQTMLQLQERLQEHIQFMAVQHDNTDKRHVHVLALVRAFVNEETLQACIDAATENAGFQRLERDLAQGQTLPQQAHQALAVKPGGRAAGMAATGGERRQANTALGSRQPSVRPERTQRQARPAPTGKPCPSCGHSQPKSATGREHVCHCTACGYQLHRNHSLRLEQEGGLGWEL